MKPVLHVFLSAFFASLLAIFPALAGMTTPWIKRMSLKPALCWRAMPSNISPALKSSCNPAGTPIGVILCQRHCAEFRFFGQSEPENPRSGVSGTVFFDDGAGGFFGYEGLTGFVVPFLLENAGEGGQVSLNLELGVCREVCLPVQFSFDLPVMPGP